MGVNCRNAKEYALSEQCLREALVIADTPCKNESIEAIQILGSLAKTLEASQKLEESAARYRQALDYYLHREGKRSLLANQKRLDLARVLHSLGRNQEALTLLQDLQAVMSGGEPRSEDDGRLASEAEELIRSVEQDL
jgi:tetratricopeptide (TPR) repeat protein